MNEVYKFFCFKKLTKNLIKIDLRFHKVHLLQQITTTTNIIISKPYYRFIYQLYGKIPSEWRITTLFEKLNSEMTDWLLIFTSHIYSLVFI